MVNEVLLTAREAAEELGHVGTVHEELGHVGTVHNAFQQNRLPFIALYSRKLISRAALEAYKQRTRPDGEKPRSRPRKTEDKGMVGEEARA